MHKHKIRNIIGLENRFQELEDRFVNFKGLLDTILYNQYIEKAPFIKEQYAEHPKLEDFFKANPELIQQVIDGTLSLGGIISSLYYTKYDYIQFDGKAWLDTAISLTADDGFEYCMAEPSFVNNEVAGLGTSYHNGIGIGTHSGGTFCIFVGTTELAGISQDSAYHVYKYYNRQASIDGSIGGTSSATTINYGNYPTFSVGKFRASGDSGVQCIKYVKLYHNSELALHLVPCVHNLEVGMWDLVSGTFFSIVEDSGSVTVGNL